MAAAVRRIVWQNWRRNSSNFLTSQATCTRIHQHIRCNSSMLEKTEKDVEKNQKSAIMAAAEERRNKYDLLIKSEQESYERGRRHLANMMGEDPSLFTQKEIDKALAYLLPTGLTDKNARPMMKPPEEYYPPLKAGQFGQDGRPIHFLFYTNNPQYYELMHNAHKELNKLNDLEDKKIAKGILQCDMEAIDLSRSEWITQDDLERRCIETISDLQFQRFIVLLERITQHPYAKVVENYVWQFRNQLQAISKRKVEPIQYDESGRAYSYGFGVRKSATASVIIRDQGSGKVTINGREFVHHLPFAQDRAQILFPFQFLDMVGRFDVEAEVTGGGLSGQGGAIRYAISMALARCFLDEQKIEQMRQAGLLTRDPRVRERKKPGRKRARKKFTWKKR